MCLWSVALPGKMWPVPSSEMVVFPRAVHTHLSFYDICCKILDAYGYENKVDTCNTYRMANKRDRKNF